MARVTTRVHIWFKIATLTVRAIYTLPTSCSTMDLQGLALFHNLVTASATTSDVTSRLAAFSLLTTLQQPCHKCTVIFTQSWYYINRLLFKNVTAEIVRFGKLIHSKMILCWSKCYSDSVIELTVTKTMLTADAWCSTVCHSVALWTLVVLQHLSADAVLRAGPC